MVERTDIKLTTELGATLNDRGDVTRVTERAEVLTQRAVLQSLNVTVDERGTTLTPQLAEDVRDRVERALINDSVLDVAIDVTIASTEGETLTLAVGVGDQQQFTLDVDV